MLRVTAFAVLGLALTAAEFRGDRVDQLEANRDRLYGIESTSPKGISGADPSEG